MEVFTEGFVQLNERLSEYILKTTIVFLQLDVDVFFNVITGIFSSMCPTVSIKYRIQE